MLMYITMIHYDSLQNFTTLADANQFRIQNKITKIKSFSALWIALRQIWSSDQAGWRREEEMITVPKKNTLEYVASALSDLVPYTRYSVLRTYIAHIILNIHT